jgi:hypothetical protein
MSQGPPLRLRDDPAVARALREDLARAAAAREGYDVAAGLVTFEETLRAGAGASGGGAAGAGGKTLLGAALKGALLGVATLGGAAVFGDRSPAPAPPPPVASVIAPAAVPREHRVAPPRPAPEETPPPPRPLETAKPLVEAAVPSRAAPVVSTEAAPPPEPTVPAFAPAPAAPASDGDPLAAEVAHLARLRAVQDRDPAAALALAEEGSRRFPRGLFAQEREAIAIGALFRVGRAAEASARARAFLAAYPRSSFAERIEKLTRP